MLIRLDQREGEAQYYLGRINENRLQYEAAIEWYEQVHVGDYKFDARLRIADLLGLLERTDEAVEHLDAMLKGSQSTGSLVRIYITKGELLRGARRYTKSRWTFSIPRSRSYPATAICCMRAHWWLSDWEISISSKRISIRY